MNIIIRSPNEIIWEGEVEVVETVNDDGPFTILPDHANFMTPLKNTEILITTTDKDTLSFLLVNAVLYLENNLIKVFVHDSREVSDTTDQKKGDK